MTKAPVIPGPFCLVACGDLGRQIRYLWDGFARQAMKFRSKNLMIGTIAVAIVGASFGGVIGYQRFSRVKQLVPFHVVFEGSASGLRQGSSVNFAGVRVGEVRSLKLDHPRRVVALALIDP